MRSVSNVALLTAALLFSETHLLVAGIEGVVETFDGRGQFTSVDGLITGLDNPGWDIDGDGVLADDGYGFENQESSVELSRSIVGAGSFLSRVEFRDLDLGEIGSQSPPDSSGRIVVIHHLGREPEDMLRVLLTEHGDDDPSIWGIGFRAGALQTFEAVPRGANIALEFRYDHVRSVVSLAYDNDTSDGEMAYEAQMEYDISLRPSHRYEVLAAAIGDGCANGVLDELSVIPQASLLGDFDGNDELDAKDINRLTDEVRLGGRDIAFDLNGDGAVNGHDRTVWLHDLKVTYFGDVNLDGLFRSDDLVLVLAAREYEDGVFSNSYWQTGDWNGDGDFTSGDLVVALADGGYEAGPRTAAVPEPVGIGLMAVAALFVVNRRRGCSKTRRA